MMRTMRSMAKWIMAVVAVSFVAFMIFEDASIREGSGAQATIARVNGQAITVTEFQAALRNEQDRLRQEQGSLPFSLEEQQAFEDQVLEQLVQAIVLEQEYRRRGIRVSDQEVIDAARSSPPPEVLEAPQFQTEGQFDPEKYQRFIASGTDPQFLLALEARYRSEIPRFKLYQQLTAGVYPSDAQLWRAYRDQFDSVTATVVRMLPEPVSPADTAALSDEELRRYYNGHRDDFDRPATAFLSYVSVSRRPTADDSAASRAHAEVVRQEVLEGADFARVAERESADSASARDGGDLGEAAWGSFVTPFENAVRGLTPGAVSDLVETPFGWHIIRLEDRTDSTFHASHILIQPAPRGDRLMAIEAVADTMDLFGAEQEDPAALTRVAEDLGLEAREAQPLFDGFRLQLGDDIVGDAGVWAFGGAEPGWTSPVVETQQAYYLFRLDSLRDAGIPRLEQIRPDVRRAALRARRLEAARQQAEAFVAEVRAGRRLEDAAADRGLETVRVGPFTRVVPPPELRGAPAAVGLAFGLGVGETGGPVNTNAASYVLRPDERVQADSSAWQAQLDIQRQRMMQQMQADRVRLVLGSLRREATVEDLRAELDRAQREAEQRGFPVNPLGF